jgi:DNA repair exonuclease SbcCD ATPase subunit/DNA repair exonuclease SbcCD nuclease subunit
MKYIIHLSDIHIRLNYRHLEYRDVFKNLYYEIDKLRLSFNEALIIITGDLLHDKTSLTSECIILCNEFLNELSNRFKTIIIPGNHDGFLNNSEKIDNISGILYGKNMKNIVYLKYSQIYECDNIIFGISSVFDNQFIKAEDINNNKIKIALYHGMVGNVKLQNLCASKGEKTIEDFKGYDFVLLGDIHKYQYLNEENTIAYASSLISQNYSETDIYHGFLLWNIENKSSKYYIIKNDWHYKRCYLKENKIYVDDKIYDINNDLDNLKNDLPKKGRIQIYFKNHEHDKVKYIKNKIKEVYWNEINEIENEKKNNLNYSILLNRKDIITNILIDHSKTIDKNIIEWIENDLKNYDIENNNLLENNFSILKINFSNLFVYGEHNEIDFRNYNKKEVILVSGKNSYGKSSLIDIIIFNLYNEYARNISNIKKDSSGILNNEKNEGYSELLLKINEEHYLIRREYKRNKKNLIETKSYLFGLYLKSSGKNNEIYEYDNIFYFKKLLVDASLVTKELIKMIGSKDNFMLINVVMQNENVSFKNMSTSERKKTLMKLLNLDKYEKILKNIDENRKKAVKDYDILNNELKNFDILEYENKYEKNKEEIVNLKITLTNHIEKSNNLKKEIDELNSCYCNDEFSSNMNKELEELMIKIKKNENEIDEIKKDKKNYIVLNNDILNNELEKYYQEKNKIKFEKPLNKELENYNLCKLLEIQKNIKNENYEWMLENLNHELELIEKNIYFLDRINDNLFIFNDHCNECLKNKKSIKELNNNKEKKIEINKSIHEIIVKNVYKKEVEQMIKYIEYKSLHDHIDNMIKKLKEELRITNINKDKINIFELRIKDLENENRIHHIKIDKINDQLKKMENNENIVNKIIDKRKELENTEINIIDINKELGQKEERYINIEEKIKEHKKKEEKMIILHYEKEKYEQYKIILGVDGLSKYYIGNYIKDISTYCNNIIKQLIEKTIDIKMIEDKIIIEIKDKKGGIVEYVGGMETLIIEISLKIVLSKIIEKSKCNILILDEGITSLDKENMANIDILFNYMCIYYENILLMSHIYEIMDKINEKIYIKKDQNNHSIISKYE